MKSKVNYLLGTIAVVLMIVFISFGDTKVVANAQTNASSQLVVFKMNPNTRSEYVWGACFDTGGICAVVCETCGAVHKSTVFGFAYNYIGTCEACGGHDFVPLGGK